MNKYILISVLIMAVFTYIPRMLPLTFFRKEIKSTFIRSLLFYVPYAVLSALTFPSIFYATGNIYSAIGGCLVGIYYAYLDKGLIFVASMAMLTSLVIGIISLGIGWIWFLFLYPILKGGDACILLINDKERGKNNEENFKCHYGFICYCVNSFDTCITDSCRK